MPESMGMGASAVSQQQVEHHPHHIGESLLSAEPKATSTNDLLEESHCTDSCERCMAWGHVKNTCSATHLQTFDMW